MASSRSTYHYLKFTSKLYELAADFNGPQLLAVERAASVQGNQMVATVASLLCKLHDYEGSELGNGGPNEQAGTADVQEGLRDILSSKEVFSTNGELVDFVRSYVDIPVAPKDSRDRIVGKVLRGLDSVDSDDRTSFRKSLEHRILSGQDAPNFVARWSKLIRDL